MSQSDTEDDDPQLKALRSVWLSMPDEDPPTRGLDALMAAARTQAETFVTPPWWKRLLHALARPPVLALATILILIGGGVLISKHDTMKDAMPTATPETSNKAPAAAEPPPPPVGQPADQMKSTEPVTPTGPGATPVTTPKPDVAPVRPRVHVDHLEVAKPPAPSKPTPARTHRPTGGEAAYEGRDVKKPEPTTDQQDRGAGDGAKGVEEAPLGEDATATTSTRGGITKSPKAAAPPPQQVLVDQLLVQCRSAATRGDCEAAKLIARRIAAQSTTFYKEHVASDATIQKCITAAAAQ